MKTAKSLKFWQFATFGLLILGLVAAPVEAQEAVCPFDNDSVVIYDSPNLWGQVIARAGQQQDFSAEGAAIEKVLDKADRELQKALEKGKLPTKQVEYILDLCKKDSGLTSASRAVLTCYAKYVDYAFLAVGFPDIADLGDDELVDKIQECFSLTIVVNAYPGDIDPRKFMNEDEVEILVENDKVLIGKLFIKDKGEVKETLYFGGTAIKDVDKYAIIVAKDLENLEIKLERFQQSNEIVMSNLEAGTLSKRLIKRHVFETIVSVLESADIDDERVMTAINAISKLRTVSLVVTPSDYGFVSNFTVETTDADTARMFKDIAAGALAAVKLAGQSKADKSDKDELGLALLNNVGIFNEGPFVSIKTEFTFEWIKKVTTLVLEECSTD